MDFTTLGQSGLKVSRLCLGTMTYGSSQWRNWVLDEDASRSFIRGAIEAGINFFDTADMYSDGRSEEVLGRAIRDFAAREAVVIATKVFFPMGTSPNDRGLGRKHILSAIDASLRRLDVDYVDLYQIHRFDRETPIEETMQALDDVVRSGKARYIGASSMYAWQFATMQHVAERNGWTRFVSMQPHYNLIYREEEREMLPFCLADGVGVIPWSPLARGFLAGNRTREKSGETTRAKSDDYAHKMYYAESDFDVLDRVIALAERRRLKPAQIALAWVLANPAITSPIIGASKPHHIDDAIGALSIALTQEEMTFLEEPYRPHPVLGHS